MTDIEQNIIPFFQKKISIYLENKQIKEGKLILFCVKDFHLNFTIVDEKNTKVLELPYPFNSYYDKSNNALVLDYKNSTFNKGISDIEWAADRVFLGDKKIKFYDSLIKIIEQS